MTSKPLPALIAVIDIGTHKTASLLGQVIDGKARMLSFSERRTDGVVKGTVTDLEKLTQCVHEVVNDIERGSNRAVEQVYLSLSGPAAEGERDGIQLGQPGWFIGRQRGIRCAHCASCERGHSDSRHVSPAG